MYYLFRGNVSKEDIPGKTNNRMKAKSWDKARDVKGT